MLSQMNQIVEFAEDRGERALISLQQVFDGLGPHRMGFPVGVVNRAVEHHRGGKIVAFGGN